MRQLLVRILPFGAAACLVWGAFLSTLAGGLFDASDFGRRSAASLGDPRVAAYAADRVTAAVLAERPDLTPVRPLLLATARVLVSSDPFRAVVRTAAASAHRALLSEDTQRIALSVPDVGVLLRSALEGASPELAEKIPLRLGTLVGQLESGPALLVLERAWALRDELRSLSWALLLASPVLLLLSLWLARDPRPAFIGAGGALATAGALLWATLPLGRAVAPLLFEMPLHVAAAQGVWDAFLAPLSGWGLFLAGLGVLFAAAGTSLMEAFDPLDALRAAWGRAIRPPESQWRRAALGLALVAAGALAVSNPGFVSQAVVVLAGLVVVFLGSRALFGLVLDSVSASPAAVRVGSAGLSVLRTAVVAALVVASAVTWLVLTRPWADEAPQVITACNGHPELCSRSVGAVSFAATHNSMSNVAIADWMFPQQQAGIPSQLRDGVRGLLIDVHYGFPGGARIKTDLSEQRPTIQAMRGILGDEGVDAALRIRDRLVGVDEGSRGLYLCHGFCELGASELEATLSDIRNFLVRRPGEVLLIVVEDYVSPKDLAEVFTRSGLGDRVYLGPSGPPWPTLRQLIESGRNVLVFIESGSEGVDWLRPAFRLMQETPYTFHKPEEFSCRENRGPADASLFQLNHWIETTPTPLPSNAEMVNAREVLLGRARQCQQERGLLPNLVAVDFYRSGDLLDVVDTLNGVGSAEGR